MDTEEDEKSTRDVEQYLDLLYIYFLALAMAGAQKAPDCPLAVKNLGEESTRYVLVPLDLLNSYHWRARRASLDVPYHARLAWLERLDTEEGSIWVFSFRDSTMTLGTVIHQTMQKREALRTFTNIPSQPRGAARVER